MNKIQKSGLNYIVLIPVIAVVIFTVIRICTDTTQNVTFGISGRVDDQVRMADASCLELEFNTPIAGVTGFSFRFTGDRDKFGDKAFEVTATVQNDELNTHMLYKGEMKLIEQAYDYQYESYIAIIPFAGDIQQGDHLCITIMGMGMSEEDNISVRASSHAAFGDAVFRINGIRQDSMPETIFYYQIKKLDVFSKLMQGIVSVLLILLVWELAKKPKIKDKREKHSAGSTQISVGKKILKVLPIMILLVVLLDYTCYAGFKMQDSELSGKMTLFFLMLSALAAGMTLVVFLCGQNGMKWEKLFFLAIFCLGILFEIVITPFAVPDEASHIDTAYRISNEMLGVEDTSISYAIYKRECDIYPDSGVKRTISEETYRWLYRDWFRTEGNRTEKLAFATDNRATTNALFFLPAAVGMTIGRVLGMGFLPTVYLARTANLLLAAWMIYLAVSKIPYGKSILCMIALLPITLQEIASCSYDALIIPISMLYVSYCVYAIYSKAKLQRADILVILITAVMLGICKGGVYTTLYLLGLWALVRSGYIRLPQKKGTRMAGIAAVTFIVLAGIASVVYLYRQPMDADSLIGRMYFPAYLIQHPWETLRIAENSLYRDTYYYMEQLFGKAMGNFQISVKFIVPIGYMILLGMAVISSEKYPYIPNTTDKCVFMITAASVFAAVQAAFLLNATVIGQYSIGGVQGRYFLPMIWPFLICFRRNNVVYKNKNYCGLVLAGYLLGVCTVLQIVISALNPSA